MSAERGFAEVNRRFRDFLGAVSLGTGTIQCHFGRGDHVFLGRSYGGNNALLAWSNHPYQAAIDAVRNVCPQVSRKTTSRILRDSMVKLFEEGAVRKDADPGAEAHLDSILPVLDREAISDEVFRLIESLRSRIQPLTAFVLMHGVELKVPRLDIGEAVLYPSQYGPLHDLAKDTQAIAPMTTEDARCILETSDFYAAIEVEGDQEQARLQAVAKAQDITHILNLCLGACRRPLHTCRAVAIVGDAVKGRQAFLFRYKQGRVGFYGATAPWTQYEIDEKQVTIWKHKGLDRVEKCFKDEDATSGELESRMRSAVTWYGRAASMNRTDESFVALTTALETLLIGRQESSGIRQRLAERVAFLLVDNYTDRLHCDSLVRELYGMRSEIVHQGKPVSLVNAHRLNDIVVGAIWNFVDRDFSSWDDFLNWIRRQKYTSSQ